MRSERRERTEKTKEIQGERCSEDAASSPPPAHVFETAPRYHNRERRTPSATLVEWEAASACVRPAEESSLNR